jgi:hypothetical protein
MLKIDISHANILDGDLMENTINIAEMTIISQWMKTGALKMRTNLRFM